MPLPTRLTFADLPRPLLPHSEAFAGDPANRLGGQDLNFIAAVVERWRGATMRRRVGAEEAAREGRPVEADVVLPAPPPASDSGRFSLLKKPLTDKPDPYAALRSATSLHANR